MGNQISGPGASAHGQGTRSVLASARRRSPLSPSGGDAMRSSILDMSQWANPPPVGLVSRHVRHVLSRRTFLGSMAGVAGATLGTGLFPTNVLAAKAPNAAPKPTSNQITLNGVTFSLTFFGPGTGRARMRATNLAMKDYFDIPNALFRFESPVSVGASASFDIHWHGPVSSRGRVTTTGSSGQLVMSQATMTWSAHNDFGFSFVSNPSGTKSVFAQLGHVKNGVFV